MYTFFLTFSIIFDYTPLTDKYHSIWSILDEHYDFRYFAIEYFSNVRPRYIYLSESLLWF